MRLRSCSPMCTPAAWRGFFIFVLAIGLVSASAFAPLESAQNKKPSISLKANPPVGFAPLRVVVTAEIKGGSNDFEDFYCASVEWDWGDETKSETKADCDPYEPGKSEIKRRYVQEHTFRSMGMGGLGTDPSGNPTPSIQHRVRFILKQKNKTVGSGTTTVEVRQGIGGEQ
jgi:hypothetical protein